MFNEDKSSFLTRWYFTVRTNFNYHFFFKKRVASMSSRPLVWGIWNVVLYGPNIHLGNRVVIVGANGYRTSLTTVKHKKGEGHISIGDRVLVMNGVRISSASEIRIGDDCMLANFCYLTDADWHDIHDRTDSPGRTAPIILERGAWIGDSAIICKGVRIGENSIVGAGSVVRRDVPPNSVAIGNPARVVKELDPERIVLMKKLYKDMGMPGHDGGEEQ
jgi:acetyltransferase-like isoleucine patch superfamily enzyme